MKNKKKLAELTKKLGKAVREEKTAKKDREKLRSEFFDLATKSVTTLAQKTVRSDASTKSEAQEEIEKGYPRWEVIEIRSTGHDWKVLIKEKPEFKTFFFANPDDGHVYQRNVVEGSPTLDDERLREEDPELWERITYIHKELKLLEPKLWGEEDQAKAEKYWYTGNPTLRLEPPRKAKPEDFDG